MKRVPITSVCDFQGGSQPPKSTWISEPREGYIRMLQIRDFTQPDKERIEFVPISKSLKICSESDILIGRYGASIGKILTGLAGAYNVAIIKTIPNENRISKKFLKYVLKAPEFQFFVQNVGSRAAQAGFNKKELAQFHIPLPDLDTQKRIVTVLDKAQRVIELREKSLELLDQLLRDTFLDMFGDPVLNPKRWEVKKLSEISKIQIGPFGSQLHKSEYISGGIPLINPTHIVNGEIIPSNDFTITHEKASELKKYLLRKGDIVMGRRGEMGRCAEIHEEQDGYFCGTGSLFLRPSTEIDPTILSFILSSSSIKAYLESNSLGTTMSNLNKSIVGGIPIVMPPISIQKGYRLLRKRVELMKKEVANSQNEIETLFSSIIQSAFNGKLELDNELG